MALIKRADADSFAREAVALHLGDLEREGETLIAQARTRAESILAKGRAERDLLIAGAAERGYKAGFSKGYAEGLAKGSEKGESHALESTTAAISALAEQWGLVLTAFEQMRERMVSEARGDIVELAAVFAEKVARRTIELDASIVDRALEAVLRRVIETTTLTIAVHSFDLERAQRLLPTILDRVGGSMHAEIVADDSMGRGSCVARTPAGGVIDAETNAEIARLVEMLLPDPDDAPEAELGTAPSADGGTP